MLAGLPLCGRSLVYIFKYSHELHFANRVSTAGRGWFSYLSQIKITPSYFPVGIYLFKVNNRNTRARCEICSKLTIKTPERRHCSSVSIVNFKHLIADWVTCSK